MQSNSSSLPAYKQQNRKGVNFVGDLASEAGVGVNLVYKRCSNPLCLSKVDLVNNETMGGTSESVLEYLRKLNDPLEMQKEVTELSDDMRDIFKEVHKIDEVAKPEKIHENSDI